jgi:hypothetical protein
MERHTIMLGALLATAAIVTDGCARNTSPVGTPEIPVFSVGSPTATVVSSTATLVPATALPHPSLQLANDFPISPLSVGPSRDLADNHIGVHFEEWERYSNTDFVYASGFKWVRIQSLTDFWAVNRIDLATFTLDSIPPSVDSVISEYASNDVRVVLDLWMGAGLRPYGTTFQTQEEIDRFMEYVRFVVSHFNGRIPYYEIWNEPGDIAVRDYANLVRAVVPIIREEDPEARVIIGAIPGSWESDYPGYDNYQRFTLDNGYLNELILSGIAPMVDGISWHPFYDNIPGDEYYQGYPRMVEGIRDLAASQGFLGEYFADEVLWRTLTEEGWAGGPPVSAIIAAKYYTRAITLHRGLGVNVTINTFFIEPEREWLQEDALSPIRNLAHTLAGAEPIDMAVSISSAAPDMVHYSFSLPNEDRLVALWANGEALENASPLSATITLPIHSPSRVIGIDVLNGFEQEMVVERENGNSVIRNLQVMDYPIILRFVD